MKVHVVDPPAYTPPYDHALCTALAGIGLDVELFTSEFAYGEVPAPVGYQRHELFYRHAAGGGGSLARRTLRLAEHAPDMQRYRGLARDADVVHFQWLTVPALDGPLLPRGRPLVLTAHDVLSRERIAGSHASQRRLYRHFDALVTHSQAGRERLIEEAGVDASRVHVIPHGAFAYLAQLPEADLPEELTETTVPVVLYFGLIRPYKGLDVLLDAWRGIDRAELWIVGRPRLDITALRAAAGPSVSWVPRFVSDSELAAAFRRADLVVLPYRQIEQSGVLATALAFGVPLVLSDVGGFSEVAAAGAARLVPPGDAGALHAALVELLSDDAERVRLGAAAASLAAGAASWESVAEQTAALYAKLVS
jgi:glycosyltransferase involved in cell wall biosynthesis